MRQAVRTAAITLGFAMALATPSWAQSVDDDITGGGAQDQSTSLLKIGGKLVVKVAPMVMGVLLFLFGAAKGVKTGSWGEAFITMGVGALLVLAPALIGYIAGWNVLNYFS